MKDRYGAFHRQGEVNMAIRQKSPIFVRVSKIVTTFAILILLTSRISLYAAEKIWPDYQHETASKIIAKLLVRYHYSHLSLNDSLSSEIFDRYLDNLDHNKSYFLSSDIQQFEKRRYDLDDMIKQGDLYTVYDIFNVYRQRVEERINFVLQRLKQPFDFTADEYYQFKRDKAPWPRTKQEMDELWRKRLKNEALSLKLSGKAWQGTLETLTKRYKNYLKRLNQYKSEDVFQLFMNAVTQSYDPHSNYFSPITSDNFRIQMSLSFEGIGARLVTEDDYTKVVEIIPGGPAELSNALHANDKIIGVGQGRAGEIVDVIGWRLDDVVQLIRGKRGTVVRLQIIPANSELHGPAKLITLVRDKIKLEAQAAKSDIIEIDHEKRHYKIGVIKIPTFYSDIAGQERGDRNYKSTARDVRRLLIELQDKNVDGIIVDLRHNGGGSLQEAIEVSGLFIKKGPVVQVRDSNGRINVGDDPDPEILYDGPLAVMVDRLSASASEIFSAAIQDYGRGILIGTQTFGKGTVQNLIPLNRFIRNTSKKLGQLKITVAKFYRINGGSTQHRGVIPDISFPSLYDNMEIGESSQPNALSWDHIRSVKYRRFGELDDLIPKLRLRDKIRTSQNEEFKFLLQDIDEAKKAREKKIVSLNEAVRKQEREQAEKKRKAREKARRAAEGLPPLKDGEKDKKNSKEKDFELKESAHILADLILLTNNTLTGSIHQD